MPDKPTETAVLQVEGLCKNYTRRRGLLRALRGVKRGWIKAVEDVSFEIGHGEVVGLAGESGSGKSVTGELIASLQKPSAGRVVFAGQDIYEHDKAQRREFRRRVSMVFQDPYDALNPRMRIRDSISEPLRVQRIGTAAQQQQAVVRALEQVGLRPADRFADAFPHQLSGGERQRAAVARALVMEPELLIADEPTTMLDVSVRTGLLNLLRDMTESEELAMLFISHDFATLSYLCDRIVIIYLGRVAEIGPAREVLTAGLHPYTRVLSMAIPVPDPDAHRERVRGSLDTSEPAREGCLFAPRCPYRMDPLCTTVVPDLFFRGTNRVACHLYSPDLPQEAVAPIQDATAGGGHESDALPGIGEGPEGEER